MKNYDNFTFKRFNNFEELKTWTIDYVERGNHGFNTDEDAKIYLDEFLFPYIKNLPDVLTLYRIILVDKQSNINRKQIGKHFTDSKSLLYDISFLRNLGFSADEVENANFYIITIEIGKENIDMINTISARIYHPQEEEIYVNTMDYKIIGINKVDNNKFTY